MIIIPWVSMQPTPPTNPKPSYPSKRESPRKHKCHLLNMMTPIFVWSSVFRRPSDARSPYQNAVNSFSTRVSDGIQHFAGDLKKTIRGFGCYSKKSTSTKDSLKSGSIRSRGYEEFREGGLVEGECPGNTCWEGRCFDLSPRQSINFQIGLV